MHYFLFQATLKNFYYLGKVLTYMYKIVDNVDILQYTREFQTQYLHEVCFFSLILTFTCSFFQLEVPNYHHLP